MMIKKTILIKVLGLLLGLWMIGDSAYILYEGTDIVNTVVNAVFLGLGIVFVACMLFLWPKQKNN